MTYNDGILSEVVTLYHSEDQQCGKLTGLGILKSNYEIYMSFIINWLMLIII